ncbi:MAG: tetratricopeptide repeat protein [Solirubrobacteraceae bacterium]
MRILRVGAVAVSLLISAWFALGWVQVRDTARATEALSVSPLSAAQRARVQSLLDTAGVLNPDSTVDLLRARLDAARHDYLDALAILKSVTASEPDNVFAWTTLGFIAGQAGRLRLAGIAGRQVARLAPTVS